MRGCLVGWLAIIGPGAGLVSAQDAAHPWAIVGATLINGTDAEPLANSVVTGRGERISCAGLPADCPIPADAAITDAGGKWLMPGLIDTHVHLNWAARPDEARRNQLRRLAFGITTTRDAGTPQTLQQNLDARVRANRADVPEPRLLVSGLISKQNVQQYGVGDVAALVDTLAMLGVDAIKIKEERQDHEVRDVVAKAHATGLPVFGHTWAVGRSVLGTALDAGIDGVSHMATFSAFGERSDGVRGPAPTGIEYWVWSKEQWNYQDDAKLSKVLEQAAQQRTWFEPMLVTEKHFTFPYPLPDSQRYLGPVPSLRSIIRPWIPGGDSGWPRAHRRRGRIETVYARMCDVVRRFHTLKGAVVTGTDDEAPGLGLVDEVRLLGECGLSAMDAIRAATADAAVALQRPDRGTIASGKLADLILLDADPLEDLARLTTTWRVMKGGHVYDPDLLLDPAREQYATDLRKVYAVRAAGFAGTLLAVGAVLLVAARLRVHVRSATLR